MNFVQISDLHISGPPHRYDIDTADKLDLIIDAIHALDEEPAFVLVSGDLVAEETAENYALLADRLSRLEYPFYLMAGNHDDRNLIRAQWPDHAYLMPDRPFLDYAIDQDGLSVLVLDSQVTGEVEGTLCPARLDWLADRLTERPGKPVVIALHHPVTAWTEEDRDNRLTRFRTLIERHGGVEAILCGHLHRTIQQSFASIPLLVAPSTAYSFFKAPETERRYALTGEPGGFVIHYRTRHGLESHVVHVTKP